MQGNQAPNGTVTTSAPPSSSPTDFGNPQTQDIDTLKKQISDLTLKATTLESRLSLAEGQIEDQLNLANYETVQAQNASMEGTIDYLTNLVKQLIQTKTAQINAASGGFPQVGGNPSFDSIEANSGTIGGFSIGPTAIFSSFLGGNYQLSMDSQNKRFAVQDRGGRVIAAIGFLNGLLKPGGGTYGATDVGVWGQLGAIANWLINTNEITSAPAGNARLSMDVTKKRFKVLDATDTEKVAMGYMGGLPIQGNPWSATKTYALGDYANDGATVYKSLQNGNTGHAPAGLVPWWQVTTDTWTDANYGFWARLGDKVTVDGDVLFQNGNWSIQNDASFLILSGTTVIARLGSLNGIKGLFINEANINAGSGFQAKLTASTFFVGIPGGSYIDFDANRVPALILSGQFQSSNYVAGSAGWRLGIDGSFEANGPSSVQILKTNVIYQGKFGDLQDGQAVFGNALPAGGSVYYLEKNLLDNTNANPWTILSGAAVYSAPPKYGDFSLAPVASYDMKLAFAFTTVGTVEGWLYFNALFTGNFVVFAVAGNDGTFIAALVINSGPPTTSGMISGTFSSGSFAATSMSFTQVMWVVGSTVYNMGSIPFGWAFFAFSANGVAFGAGSTITRQSVAISTSNPSVFIEAKLRQYLQLSNVMVSVGYSDTLADFSSAFGSALPYGTVSGNNLLVTQAANGIRWPYLPSASPDPATVDGASLYKLATGKFRGRKAGVWRDFAMDDDIATLTAAIAALTTVVSGKQTDLAFVIDARNTTGGTRAETVNPLSVGQTAIIQWQIQRSSGTITIALPAGGTYEVSMTRGAAPGAANTLFLDSTTMAVIGSAGGAAGGSSVSVLTSTNGATFFGYVKRTA